MFTLVIGGSASGKSEYAEKLVTSRPGKLVYLATMAAWDEESKKRIARHRQMRAGKGFETVECPVSVQDADIQAGSNVLLEDLDNLIANELFSENGGGAGAVLSGVLSLLDKCADLTVVSGEVFSGGTDYLDDTLSYLKTAAAINRTLAAKADRVVEVVCGLPNVLKREGMEGP